MRGGQGFSPGGNGAVLASAPAGNPNLLLWTEEFQQAAWTTDSTVTADAGLDPLGGSTADQIALISGGSILQTSTTAAATGATASTAVTPTTSWVRYSISGAFNSLDYTLSVYMKGALGVEEIGMRIARVGGFLQAQFIELTDAGAATILLWGAQLEQAAAASAYQKREGT